MTGELNSTLRVVRGYSVAGIVGILVVVGGMGVAASLIQVSGAVIATGTVSIVDNVKTIAHPLGGVVSEIDVRDGDKVSAGESLFILDSRTVQEEIDATRIQIDMSEMTLARLQALHAGSSSVSVPASMKARESEAAVAALLELQNSLLAATQAAASATSAQIDAQVEQLQIELDDTERSKQASEALRSTNTDKIASLESAPATLATPAQLADLNDRVVDADAETSSLSAQISGIQSALTEHQHQLDEIQSSNIVEVLAETESEQKNLAALTSNFTDATAELESLRVLSPVDGIVAESSLHTIGGVLAPGETVMTVVPVGVGLAVEAKLGASDIEKARKGGDVRVMFSGLDQSTPQLDGKISGVAPDAAEDPQTGSRTYAVKIALPQAELDRLGPNVELLSGMPAEVFITTQERSVISYLAEPLVARLTYAFRED